MADTEIIADFPGSGTYSSWPAHVNSVKDKRHWMNLTAVTDTDLDLEVTSDAQMIVLSGATATVDLNLPPSDSDSAGMSFYYYVSDATFAVTIVRDGSDTINGSGADLTPSVNTTGRLTSLGDGNWAHAI